LAGSKLVITFDAMKMTWLPSLAACFLIPLSLKGNDIEPSKEFQLAYPNGRWFSAPIRLDGNLSEWGFAASVNAPLFSIPKGSGPGGQQVSFEPYGGGTWTGPDDHSVSLRIGYQFVLGRSSESLFLGITVTDDYHEHASATSWDGDSVQVMITDPSRTSQIAHYNYAFGGVEGALGSVIIDHEFGPGGTAAAISRNSTTHQTIYEIELPQASIGIPPPNNLFGMQFGLAVCVNDGDQASPGKAGWSGLGPHALVFGKTPSEAALVTFVPEPGSLSLCMTGAIGAMAMQCRKRQR
jgi:hypothetical protein